MTIYRDSLQDFGYARQVFELARAEGLTPAAREHATRYVCKFRERPQRPKGMEIKGRAPPGAGAVQWARLFRGMSRYRRDHRNPTLLSGRAMVAQRVRRLLRHRVTASVPGLFEHPVEGEAYVLFPLHFQPEASTLILAPYYLNQIALLQDISKSLPVGIRLYVKEHVSSQGRRPLSYYQEIKQIFGVRLISPAVDTWSLVTHASAIAVITGTMGWEGVLFRKPVVTFGNVFYNALSFVHRASEVPKDRWYELFRRAIFDHAHDEDELLAFVWALYSTSFEAEMHGPSTIPRVLEPSNVDRLADAIETVLAREHEPLLLRSLT